MRISKSKPREGNPRFSVEEGSKVSSLAHLMRMEREEG